MDYSNFFSVFINNFFLSFQLAFSEGVYEKNPSEIGKSFRGKNICKFVR